jgi:hypothetical protein
MWKWFVITQYESTRHPEKRSYIRMNFRNSSFASGENNNCRCTTREVTW